MGIRHLDYGTENGHYAAVAENLIAVLGEHLSKEGPWTEEMAAAWQEALTAIASIMIDAADHPENYTEELANAGYDAKGYRHDSVKDWELPAA